VVIGFATSCMNRRWQLQQTLAHNLEVLRGTGHFQAVVDYGSTDDLGALLREHQQDVAAGTLVCFETSVPREFHMSVAKNTAHRLALRRGATILFNLDADNYVTSGTVQLIEQTFRDSPDRCLHNLCASRDDGSAGRIALSAQAWRRLGGYDESLLASAWQDIDLLYRCRALGLAYCHSERGLRAPVPNTFAQKLEYLEPAGEIASWASPSERYVTMRRLNMMRSLGRGPVCLPFEQQRRFPGLVDFSEPAEI
jgi:hypothetical protein